MDIHGVCKSCDSNFYVKIEPNICEECAIKQFNERFQDSWNNGLDQIKNKIFEDYKKSKPKYEDFKILTIVALIAIPLYFSIYIFFGWKVQILSIFLVALGQSMHQIIEFLYNKIFGVNDGKN